eukprot:354489-Chlamydomonas_euryale.AAC.7
MLHVWHNLALAAALMDNVVQPFLVCDRLPGSAVDPGLGLVHGALCNENDLGHTMKLLRPEKPAHR